MLKNITTVFPGGSEKWKFNNDDKHGHGQEQRRPSTYVEGEKYAWRKQPTLFDGKTCVAK